MTQKFKLTYATMFNPPDELHTRFEDALTSLKSKLVSEYGMIIAGKDHFSAEKFENRSPIDTDMVLGVFQRGSAKDAGMALNAARRDAQRRLAERIKGLRLTSRTQVRDFITESDVITTELNAHLVGAEEINSYLHHDELIAEVTMRVPTEQVNTSIKRLHSRHYKGDDIKGSDIEIIFDADCK